MNQDNRDARFDAAMRQLHGVATERISGRTRLQLQQPARTASAARPAMHRFGWPLAASFAGVLALMVGLQLRHDPAPLPAPPAAANVVADNSDDIDAVLDENPDLYLWLASNDAYALAME